MADNCLKTSDKISFGVVSAAQASVMGPVGALWSVGVLSYLYSYENPSSCPDYKPEPEPIKEVTKPKPVEEIKPVQEIKKVEKINKVKPVVKVKPIKKIKKPIKQIKEIKEPIKQIKEIKEPIKPIEEIKESIKQIEEIKEPIKPIKQIEKPIKYENIDRKTYDCGDRVYKNFISFDYDSYDVNIYPSILNDLSNDKIKSIRIEGNTDKYGSDKYNKILGLVRAMVVKELLIENNIDKDKLSIVSNGSRNPLSNDTTENRRVDLIITYYKNKNYNTNIVKNTKKYTKPEITYDNTSSTLETVYTNFVNFKYTSYDIDILPSLLDNLSNNKIKSIIIEGNTDKFGSSSYNEKLGQNRANAVKELLIENNIDASKLSIISNASRNPISDDDAKNRRVDLIVTYYNKGNVQNNTNSISKRKSYSSKEKIYTNFINFKYTSYDIDTLPSLLNNLSNDKIKSIRIEGNTDKFGTSNSNEKLGLDRANAVKELLIENNIDASKLSIISNASRNPISDDDAKNRRVDLIVTYYNKENIQNNTNIISTRKLYSSKEKMYNNFINFKYDSYDIDSFPSKLDNLSNDKIKSIRIEGNTDNHGTSEHNKILGLNRAIAVKELLIENNIDEFKLSIVSNSNKNPISNDNEQNRRVDLIITYYK
jgi:outer membrane protein OmpA-like peptidoglycan-associated protein